MKQLLCITLFSILLTAFTVQKYNSQDITQMVVTLQELDSKALQKYLEEDINNLSGIQFIETSLISKTLVLNYDANKLALEEFYHILNKWGCSPSNATFQTLDSVK